MTGELWRQAEGAGVPDLQPCEALEEDGLSPSQVRVKQGTTEFL